MRMKTPRAQVRGLGSAKDGTGHWWMQRITAIALAPLAILFLVPWIRTIGGDWGDALATYRHPFNAIVAALFIATACYHLKLGLQVVIEDYIPAPGLKTGLLIGNALFCALLGFAGVFSVLMIAVTV